MPTFAALPERAIERLFARFAAMYGDAAMKRMWGQQDSQAVKAIWAESLSRFAVEDLLAGLRALEASERAFPPTLPEFVAACRKPSPIPESHRPALPVPDRTPEEIAAGHALAQRIARDVGRAEPRDPAAWAYRAIERYKGGDKVVAHASYKCALEALHNLGRTVPA